MSKIRPNPVNLGILKEWADLAGGGSGPFLSGRTHLIQKIQELKDVLPFYRLALIALIMHIRPSGRGGAFPSHKRLSQEAGCSVRSIKRAFFFWRKAGVLVWTGKWMESNSYTLKAYPGDLKYPSRKGERREFKAPTKSVLPEDWVNWFSLERDYQWPGV